MKIYFLSATFAAYTFSLAAAGSPDSGNQAPTTTVFRDSIISKIPSTNEMLTEILATLGLQQNFELKEAKVANIEASISHRKRYILYNPEYIKWINGVTKDKWAAMALLAHEIGHHLNGHTIRRSGSKPALELEADEFAGFVLKKMGASLSEAQQVMKYIAKSKGSKTHPGRLLRMSAIKKGWNRASDTAGIGTASKRK